MKMILIFSIAALGGGFILAHNPCAAGNYFSTNNNNVAAHSGISQNTNAIHSVFADTARLATVKLKVAGIDCSGCTSFIHKTLSATEGIISDEVKYPGNIAIVKYDPAKISYKRIVSIINKLGYKAEMAR
ncbi:MAG: heavy-metal-associated domain-containing protein [Chitinophagaceae bacterium]|jgi:copper chaperone CopZ|nr:MAG: heavy-metal-associated domain-containing protein [Chitinophagaceae bacterium]